MNWDSWAGSRPQNWTGNPRLGPWGWTRTPKLNQDSWSGLGPHNWTGNPKANWDPKTELGLHLGAGLTPLPELQHPHVPCGCPRVSPVSVPTSPPQGVPMFPVVSPGQVQSRECIEEVIKFAYDEKLFLMADEVGVPQILGCPPKFPGKTPEFWGSVLGIVPPRCTRTTSMTRTQPSTHSRRC